MTTPTKGKTEVARRLTAAEAEDLHGKQPGQVWDEATQDFVPLGTALVIEQMGKPVDLAKNLESFEANRTVVLTFIRRSFVEAQTDDKGKLVPGQLGDFYQVPGSEAKALTKRGASKIKQLFRWSRGAARRVAGEETREYCSATIELPLVDQFGRIVGAGIGACNTAEKAFTSENAIKKYGGWCAWNKEKKQLDVSRAPDYRAALHDVVSKATKRADTQATIVAAALEELFTVARDDEGEKKDDEEAPPPVYPGAPPAYRFPKTISTGEFKHLAGKLITDDSITVEDLTKLAAWCRSVKTSPANAAAVDRIRGATDDELERRRHDDPGELGL